MTRVRLRQPAGKSALTLRAVGERSGARDAPPTAAGARRHGPGNADLGLRGVLVRVRTTRNRPYALDGLATLPRGRAATRRLETLREALRDLVPLDDAGCAGGDLDGDPVVGGAEGLGRDEHGAPPVL